jgi:hypothetical protein
VLTSTPFSGFNTFNLNDPSDQGFLWKQLPAGTYVFASYKHQNQWALCFAKQTKAFQVQPAQKLCLGRLDSATFEQALTAYVVAHGDVQVKSGYLTHYFDGIPPVETDMAKISRNPDGSISLSPSQAVVWVEDAQVTPAYFKLGHTLYGMQICGGYGRQSSQPSRGLTKGKSRRHATTRRQALFANRTRPARPETIVTGPEKFRAWCATVQGQRRPIIDYLL